MNAQQRQTIEHIQRAIVRTIATHPAGRNLVLIGGFRLRLLDESVRASDDIDYHWAGDLDEKQRELITLFKRVLLPEIAKRLRYEGQATPLSGHGGESPTVRVIELAFWREGVPRSRIEIPVELTRISCVDPVGVRTVGGVIYPTVSDADMIESKVISIFNRITLRHRDIVDLFLFRDRLVPDSLRRIDTKLRSLKITRLSVSESLAALKKDVKYHAKAVQAVIDMQLDTAAAEQINDTGGGNAVLDAVLPLLDGLSRGSTED